MSIPLLIISCAVGLSIVLGTILHHRRETLRIRLQVTTDPDDFRRGVRSGLMQAREILGGISFTYDSEKATARNVVLGAAKTLDLPT